MCPCRVGYGGIFVLFLKKKCIYQEQLQQQHQQKQQAFEALVGVSPILWRAWRTLAAASWWTWTCLLRISTRSVPMGCEEEGEETTMRAGLGEDSLTPSWNITANITRSEKSHEIKDLTAGAQSREGPTEEKRPTEKAINQSANQ